MREALARSDLDFISKSDGGNRKSEPARLPKILRVASIATAVLFGTVIIVNALFLQDRKHAAPLLRAPDATDAAPAAPAMPVPPQRPLPAAATVAPPAAPAPAKAPGRDVIADEINRVTTVAPDRKPAKPAPIKSDEDRRDPIASLLGASTEANASVMTAQKALLRLGYVIRADGIFGTTTRQAIEHYERDNKLPVHGELTPKLARALAAKAGIAAQ